MELLNGKVFQDDQKDFYDLEEENVSSLWYIPLVEYSPTVGNSP